MSAILDEQESTLRKRVVTQIRKYPEPKLIYQAITAKEYEYPPQYKPEYPIRDRAIMASYYASAGRGAEVCGGKHFTRSQPAKENEQGQSVCIVCEKILKNYQRKFCGKECRLVIHSHKTATVLPNDHQGLLIENIIFKPDKIIVNEMPTVKRSETTIQRHPLATIRQPFWLPLELGKGPSKLWDQLVPFAWLIKEYWDLYVNGKRSTGKLFQIQNKQAYRIVRFVTGNYLNWFRAQSKQFYGKYLFEQNTYELMQFVNDQDFKTESSYTRYSAASHWKDKEADMDFDWITPAVEEIKARIEVSQ
jgi:hypothetical protein